MRRMGVHRRSVAAIAFAKWLESQPSQAAAALLLSVGQQYVSKVERGERIPRDFDLVESFRSVAGIPPGDWKRFPPAQKRASRQKRAA